MTGYCWIKTVEEDAADATLRHSYDAVRGPHGELDNLYRAFSLRDHCIKPADDLYRAVLHNDGNTLAKRDSELFGVYVAMLAQCDYAVTHHSENFRHLNADDAATDTILQALSSHQLDQCGDEKTIAALRYIRKLALEPHAMTADDIESLRSRGWSDGEVLEIVQINAMFSYFVRVINGLGISTHGERIGFY